MAGNLDRPVRWAILAVGLLGFAGVAEAAANAPPEHRVIACYFHRTVRCPTCRKISAYIEEATKAGFPKQISSGKVQMMMVDFQDATNQELTTAYGISGPTLVIMNVRGDEVAAWKTAPKVWSLVGQKDEFFKYVQGEIRSYLEGIGD